MVDNDLLIKGVNDNDYVGGYDTYHVRMGSGFIDAIEGGYTLKETIENDSRIEDGVRIIVNSKIAKRTFNLSFNIHGSTKSDYMTNKKNFEQMLCRGVVHLKVNDDTHTDYYHLVYTGKSVSYKHSYNGKFGIFTAQFLESNPTDRGRTQINTIRVL